LTNKKLKKRKMLDARRNILPDGTGARKKKADHVRHGSKSHRRSFRDLGEGKR